MSSTRIEGIHPRLAEFGGATTDVLAGVSNPIVPKLRIVGPAASKRLSRGLTGAIRRPSEHNALGTDTGDHHHRDHHHHHLHHSQETSPDMTISNHPKTTNLYLPSLVTNYDEDDDDFDEDDGQSPYSCETPIPPLPRARIPSRLGAVSAHVADIQEPDLLAAQDMILIGRPASTASYNRMSVSQAGRRKGEGSLDNIPSTPLLMDDAWLESPVTSLENDLKQLLFCQSMGVKIVTKARDFVPGTTAQLLFHCPRCLKHWKLSGQPQDPGTCQEPDEPTQGPEFTITNQSHQIMQQLGKLPEDDKRHLIEVLSRTGSPGADEELMELVNSTSSGILRVSSSSPHASRRSRSPEKRNMMRLSKDRDVIRTLSPSPAEKGPHRSSAEMSDEKRTRSAQLHKKSVKPRSGAASAGTKVPHDCSGDVSLPSGAKEDINSSSRRSERSSLKENDVIEEEENRASIMKADAGQKELVPEDKTTALADPAQQQPDSRSGHIQGSRNVPRYFARDIPKGERSTTGQAIVELEDIDGAKYHGFLSTSGQFLPIAKLEGSGKRIPIAVKPDGTYCAITTQGCRSLSSIKSYQDNTKEFNASHDFAQDIVEMTDTTGAVVRGYRDIGSKFVPIARIDSSGNEQAVMVKPNGSYFVQSTDPCGKVLDHIVRLPDYNERGAQHLEENKRLENPTVEQGKVRFHAALKRNCFEDNVIEVNRHDGFKYLGFQSPDLGFVPTARLDNDTVKRPVVMNAEGRYTVVNENGIMEDVHLHCREDVHQKTLGKCSQCSVCKLLASEQSLSRATVKRLPVSSSSYSSDGAITASVSLTEVRKRRVCPTPEMNGVLHVEQVTGSDEATARGSYKSFLSQSIPPLTMKRGLDGSLYHGRCYLGGFVPVFRMDEKGNKYPIMKNSDGKYYIIDTQGRNRYIDDDSGDVEPSDNEINFVRSSKVDNARTTREYNGNVFEGRHTIDGRFVPVARVDELGNRQTVILSKNGRYVFVGEQGKANYVDFSDKTASSVPAVRSQESSKNMSKQCDDGFTYEGHLNADGEFLPTFRVNESGYRQMVLRNEEGQSYVIAADGQEESVPFVLPSGKHIIREAEPNKNGTSKSSHVKQSRSKPKRRELSSNEHIESLNAVKSQTSYTTTPVNEKFGTKVINTPNQHDSLWKDNSEEGSDSSSDSVNISEHSAEVRQNSAPHYHSSKHYGNLSSVPPADHIPTPSSPGKYKRGPFESGITMENLVDQQEYQVLESRPETDMKASLLHQQRSSHDNDAEQSTNVTYNEDHNDRDFANLKQRKRRESNVCYLGVTGDEQQDASSAPQTEINDPNIAALQIAHQRRQSDASSVSKPKTSKGRSKDEHEEKLKPSVKNTAVHNVTGRPDTKAGQFKKHVFATPASNLTNTFTLGNAGMDKRELEPIVPGDSTSKPSSTVANIGNIRLPSLPEAPQVPDDLDTNSQLTSSGEKPETKVQKLPSPDLSERANTLPPVDEPRRGNRAEKRIKKKVAAENRRRASKAPAGGLPQGTEETNDFDNKRTDEIKDRSPSPAPSDLISKYSRFKLTTDQPTVSPPPPSNNQASYRMTYSTLPSRLRSPTLPTAATFSPEQSKSPEPTFSQKTYSPVDASTKTFEEFIIPAGKKSSIVLRNERSKSLLCSRTSLSSRVSSRMLFAQEDLPDSVGKIWQEHQREVEMMRQKFLLSLTSAFTFSMYELPEQYEEENARMMQKAKQLRTLKKPTKLGKPPKILQKPKKPAPLKKEPKKMKRRNV